MNSKCNPPSEGWRFVAGRVLARAALVFCSSVGSLQAAEEVDPRWNVAGWTPALTVSLGVHGTQMYGFVRATDSMGLELPGRPPDDSQKTAVTPMLHIGLSVDSPTLPHIPGDLRLFGSVDYFVTFPPERFVASEGDAGEFRILDPLVANVPEEAIEGQGSYTQAVTNRSAYGFTAGVSIPFEVMGVGFRLRPGASWMRYQWDVRGVIQEAIKVENVPTLPIGREFRGVELRAHGKLYSHGVGPYLGLEVEPTRLGPALVGFFAEGAYFRTLGDRDMNISDAVTIDDSLPNLPSPETYQGRWGLRVRESFWRAGVGIRVYLAADR